MHSTSRTEFGIAAALAVAACGAPGGTGAGEAGASAVSPAAETEPEAPPLRVAFGSCTAQDVAFVSGPRAIESDVGYVAEAPQQFSTGWGTIGTGRYGTIGHGSGTGSGYGTGSRHHLTPRVRIGNATATGDLDKNIIRRYIRRKLPRIKYCYEKQLLVAPGLRGTVVAQFTIGPDGKVSASRASGMSSKVSDCVAEVIAATRFPKPKGGGVVVVRYPFTFRAAATPPATGARDDDEHGGTGTREEPVADDHDQAVEDEDEAEEGAEGGILGELTVDDGGAFATLTGTADFSSGLDDADVYGGLLGDEVAVTEPVPAHPSPLQARRDAIAACFERAGRSRGVMVVDLDIASGGTVTAARGHTAGGDARVAACVAAVSAEVEVEPAEGPRAWRCPLAYGEVVAAAHVDVDIGDTEITYRRVGVGDPVAIANETEPTWKVDALYDALTRGDAGDEEAPPVAEAGPLIVRVVDDTRAKVVFRVIATVAAAGRPLVLAARDGDGWRPLRDPGPLPLVPVPRHTGGAWTRPSGHASFGGEETPRVGVLVAGDSVWLGVSVVDEVVQIRRGDGGAIDLAAVAEVLARFRGSDALSEGAAYAEVSAEDPVRFRALVTMIEAVEEAGFADWRLVAPNELAIRVP